MSVKDFIVDTKTLPDGRIVELMRMLFNYRIYIRQPGDPFGYDDCWCYQSRIDAGAAFDTWDGEGEPPGWNKHPTTGRWRGDGLPGSEINQRTHKGPWT